MSKVYIILKSAPEKSLTFGNLDYGVAQLEDYDQLKDIKLTQDGFGLYSLHGHRLLILNRNENVLVVYQG